MQFVSLQIKNLVANRDDQSWTTNHDRRVIILTKEVCMSLFDPALRSSLDLFQRTYHALLRSSGEIQIQALVEPYKAAEPSLHEGVSSSKPDLSALVYTSLRLSDAIGQVRLLLLGQSNEVFARHGYGDVQTWRQVIAPGRRRKMFFDGRETLAVLIASPSDLDDLIPMLVAYQIEWNKIHHLLRDAPAGARQIELLESARNDQTFSLEGWDGLLNLLGLEQHDLGRLTAIWGAALPDRLLAMAHKRKRFAVRMLGGSLMDYQRATLRWWWHIEASTTNIALSERPIYFVSSNTHSLINLLSGFALRHTDELLAFLEQAVHEGLRDEYARITSEEVSSSRENFFYYVQKKYQADPSSREYFARRAKEEASLGISRISSRFYVDVDTQLIELGKLDPARLDPRLRVPGIERLRTSDALVINIDYPLGLAAYNILTIVGRSVGQLCGVYVLGKAATLNGKIGDVLIPNTIYDEHTDNTYVFANSFAANDVEPYLVHGSVLDNQRALTVRGTFLQNRGFLDALHREFITDVEMEAGPYLSAVYEQSFPERTPRGQTVSFLKPPYDLGFLHYASDTPASKGQNLGSQNLSYFGMDPTYATGLAVARRILEQEVARLDAQQSRLPLNDPPPLPDGR